MRRVKRRIWSGSVLEQEIYFAAEGKRPIDAKPKMRFRSDEERAAHREKQALREFTRWVNANFTDADLYVTLTFDDAHEVHTFEEAKRLRANFARRIQRRWPEAVFCIFLGRGETTSRIHAHMIIKGVPGTVEEAQDALLTVWGMGRINRVEKMRKRNILRNGAVVGRDYSGLAAYLWRHWTPEQGGQHCLKTRNGVKSEREDAAECRTSYSEARPPKVPAAPDGWEWVLCDYESNPYGFQWFKWVLSELPKAPGRPRKSSL